MVWINPGAGRGKSPLVIGGLIRHLSFVFFSKANYSKYKVGESEIAVQRRLFVPFPHFLKGQLIHFKCKNVCVTYGIVIIGRGQNNDPQKAECLSLWTKKLPDVTENSKRSKTYYINIYSSLRAFSMLGIGQSIYVCCFVLSSHQPCKLDTVVTLCRWGNGCPERYMLCLPMWQVWRRASIQTQLNP